MWIETPKQSTKSLAARNENGERIALEFNHNGRAQCTKDEGEFLMDRFPGLKKVSGPGSAPKEEATEDPELTDEESSDDE